MRIRLPYTLVQMIMEGASLVGFVGAMLYLAAIWRGIPAQIPTNYDAAGVANAMGGKGSLIFLMAVNAATYLTMTAVGFFPGVWNTPVRLTPENTVPVLSRTRSFLCLIKLYVVAMFGYIAVAMARSQPLGAWFLPVTLILMFGTIGVYMVRMVRMR